MKFGPICPVASEEMSFESVDRRQKTSDDNEYDECNSHPITSSGAFGSGMPKSQKK